MKLNVFEGLAVAAAMVAVFTPALGATITISCGALGVEQETCREATEAWTRQSGHNVKVISTPNSSTARLSLYQQILSASLMILSLNNLVFIVVHLKIASKTSGRSRRTA